MSVFPNGRFTIAISGLVAVFVIGTLGYMLIEDWSFLDSLFMTAETLSTVGYGQVHPLSDTGKIFTIGLIISGIGVMFYTATAIVQYVAEGQFRNTLGRRRVKEKIKKLHDHFIICGYGRVGQEVASYFKSEGVPFVVIELRREPLDRAIKDGCLCIEGDVTSDDALNEAGIEKARAIIAAVGNDVDNVYVTLSAREKRRNIFIAARASAEDSERKLKRAGADRIIFPERLGGRRLAMLALRPLVVDFVDTTMDSRDRKLSLEDIRVSADSPIAGRTVGEGQRCCGGATILAVKKKDGSLIANPSVETFIEPGDEVVAIGTKEQMRALEGSGKPPPPVPNAS
ncbi:MAG: potassium channel protein [Dehalococcoidia bacterium]|nr:potassium channel protein [Dehalococcoidia bacterium]